MTPAERPGGMPEAGGEAERYRVQSLGRALDLLELIAARGGQRKGAAPESPAAGCAGIRRQPRLRPPPRLRP